MAKTALLFFSLFLLSSLTAEAKNISRYELVFDEFVAGEGQEAETGYTFFAVVRNRASNKVTSKTIIKSGFYLTDADFADPAISQKFENLYEKVGLGTGALLSALMYTVPQLRAGMIGNATVATFSTTFSGKLAGSAADQFAREDTLKSTQALKDIRYDLQIDHHGVYDDFAHFQKAKSNLKKILDDIEAQRAER